MVKKKSDPFRDDMKDDDGSFYDSWKPNVGDMITGEIVGYDTFTGGQYGPVVICNVHDEEKGEILAVWISTAMLIGKFDDLKPKVGERVGIKRLQDHPDKKYKRWVVKVDRAAEANDVPDFGGTSPSDAPEPISEEPATVPAGADDDDDDGLPF